MTVSIVTWNHAASVRACVESVLVQMHRPLEVIIRDNASVDDTTAVLRSLVAEHPGALTVHLDSTNTGFCGGHNRNMALARGEFILLANPDVVFHRGYVSHVVAAFGHGPDVGAVCGVLIQSVKADGARLVDAAGLAVSRSRQFRLVAHGLPDSSLPPEDFEVFGADGAAPTYRRTMIQACAVGGAFFDEAFFAHKEDHDVAWRSRLLGWKTICARQATAVHPRNFRPDDLGYRRRMAPDVRRHAVKNQLLLLLKNEDLVNLLLDAPWIVGRQLATLAYVVLFERDSLPAYLEVIRLTGHAWRQRRVTMVRRALGWKEMRRLMRLPSQTGT